jgi:hypothetical protein
VVGGQQVAALRPEGDPLPDDVEDHLLRLADFVHACPS